jgi:hypothetical protein
MTWDERIIAAYRLDLRDSRAFLESQFVLVEEWLAAQYYWGA